MGGAARGRDLLLLVLKLVEQVEDLEHPVVVAHPVGHRHRQAALTRVRDQLVVVLERLVRIGGERPERLGHRLVELLERVHRRRDLS